MAKAISTRMIPVAQREANKAKPNSEGNRAERRAAAKQKKKTITAIQYDPWHRELSV